MSKYKYVWLIILVFTFLLLRLSKLNDFPVFADEAIYIRWAQLIRSEPEKFIFYPMYDGKTPLHMWLLSGFLSINPIEPLWSARLLSVFLGMINIMVLYKIVQYLNGKWFSHLLVILLYILLPYTLFHDRMALIDTLLVTTLALTFWGILKLKDTQSWKWAIASGFFWGLALLSKLPALFFAPIILLIFLLPKINSGIGLNFNLSSKAILASLKEKFNDRQLLQFGVVGVIGLLMLMTLKYSEFFPFLFQRGSDFTFSPSELLAGEWRWILKNFFRVTNWLIAYLTPVVISIPLIRIIVFPKANYARTDVILLFLAIAYALPYIIFGKVVASRYLLPVVIFIIPACALSFEMLWRHSKLFVFGLLLIIGIQSFHFAGIMYIDYNNTPFTKDDRVQYLQEWSSGHGIRQIRDFIEPQLNTNKIAVATEGYFGTLPDGLMIYFAEHPLLDNIEIFGVGQPIVSINEKIMELAKSRKVYIVVNSHRQHILDSGCCKVIARYHRPNNAPELLLLIYHNHKTQ